MLLVVIAVFASCLADKLLFNAQLLKSMNWWNNNIYTETAVLDGLVGMMQDMDIAEKLYIYFRP